MLLKDLNLKDLINPEEWQNIQDSFAEAFNLTIRTVCADGQVPSKVSQPVSICDWISPENPKYADFCGGCISNKDAQSFSEIVEDANFKCSFGLDLFVIPIKTVANKVIAHIILGPVILNSRKEPTEYEKYAEGANVRLDDLMDALLDIRVFSYNKIYTIIKLVKGIFAHIVKTAYHKKRLGEMAPEMREMDPLFFRYYEEKILNAMLNACTLALDVDSGSVMTLDKKTKTLHIKVASKLDDAVVSSTNLKVGEGIAGVAAACDEPIVLPDDENRRGLSDKMKRKYIKSSLIVPFPRGKNHEVYGVINLNMVRKDRNFSQKDIALVQELVNLSSTALVPFQKTNSSADSNLYL